MLYFNFCSFSYKFVTLIGLCGRGGGGSWFEIWAIVDNGGGGGGGGGGYGIEKEELDEDEDDFNDDDDLLCAVIVLNVSSVESPDVFWHIEEEAIDDEDIDLASSYNSATALELSFSFKLIANLFFLLNRLLDRFFLIWLEKMFLFFSFFLVFRFKKKVIIIH